MTCFACCLNTLYLIKVERVQRQVLPFHRIDATLVVLPIGRGLMLALDMNLLAEKD